MIDRRNFLRATSAATVAVAVGSRAAAQDARLPVVATFSILGDLVTNVGGERVAVTTLVGADEDAHVYQSKPSDGRALAAARVVVMNGLAFEGWMRRLVRSSGTRATIVEAATGIDRIRAATGHTHGHSHGHAHGEWDPHAWQSVTAVKRYVQNIRDTLIAADDAGRSVYEANAAGYTRRLDEVDAEVRATVGRIAAESRKAITTHDAFAYFERDYGFDFIPAQGVSTDAEPTAQQIARLIRQIREQGVRAVFAENITNPRLVERIARETGARMGGTLYSDALSGASGPAATYIDLMRHNARTIASAIVTA